MQDKKEIPQYRPDPRRGLSVTRRDALRGAAGAVLAGIAGCTSGPMGGGDRSYTEWLYEPGTVTDNDHYSFQTVQADQIVEHEDELDSEVFSQFEEDIEGRYESFNLDIDDIQSYVSFRGSRVLTGSFDLEEIREELEEDDYDSEEHEGYDIFVGPDERNAFGLRGDTILSIQSFYYDDMDDGVETLIDTKRGETDRYVDESDDFDELVTQLGSGTIRTGRTFEEADSTDERRMRFDDQVARGVSLTLNGQTSELRMVLVFDESNDIDTEEIKEVVEEQAESGSGRWIEGFDNIEVSKSGRSAIVTGTEDTDDVLE